ncbi:MAG: hypothetical protein PVF15_10490 [Candidatus Bathyarchaeota archaeon]
MSVNSRRERYPYSRNRVLLSGVLIALSAILSLSLLLTDITLMLYYFASTLVVTAITFFLKKRFYPLLTSRNAPEEKEMKGASWKMILIAFFMLLGSIAIPLLLAGILSGPVWFITITGFITGVNISEIVLYIQATSNQ